MTVRHIAVTGLLVVALSLSGCAQRARQDPKLIESVAWVATELRDSDGSLAEVTASGAPDARFAKGTVSGNAGVNTYSARYKAGAGGRIELGRITATLIAGSPERMAVERAFVSAMEGAMRYRVMPDGLELFDDRGTLLARFEPRRAARLEGTDWVCAGYANADGGLVTGASVAKVTAHFAEGRISGVATINSYTATFTVDANAMSVGPAATTRMSGPSAQMDQESAFLATLPRVARYAIVNDELVLYDGAGTQLAVFRVASAAASQPATP